MKNLQTIQRYIGAASETKPTGLRPGSEFLEYDTKETYITYDGTNWVRNDIQGYTYEQSIAEGLRTNHSAWVKYGYNPSVGASAEEIWGAGEAYAFPTSAAGMEVVSSATSDTASGSGARTVKVYYLNASYEEKTEIVTMNGTSVVPTASVDFFRVNFFKVQSAGSTGTAIGDVDIRHLDNTPVYSRILAGTTRARDLIYTVPKGKELYIQYGAFSVVHTAANKFSLVTIRANYDVLDSISSSLFYPESSILLDNGTTPIPLTVPLKVPEGTDIKGTASSNGTAAVAVALRGWIETE